MPDSERILDNRASAIRQQAELFSMPMILTVTVVETQSRSRAGRPVIRPKLGRTGYFVRQCPGGPVCAAVFWLRVRGPTPTHDISPRAIIP
jgi:hypothetical protein